MQNVTRRLQAELTNKMCTMCAHYVVIPSVVHHTDRKIGVCTKLKVIHPVTINEVCVATAEGDIQPERTIRTACNKAHFSAGGKRFKLYVKCKSNE